METLSQILQWMVAKDPVSAGFVTILIVIGIVCLPLISICLLPDYLSRFNGSDKP